MITNTLLKTSIFLSAFTLFLGILFSSINVHAADQQPFALKKYPTLKFGFTSQNLAKWLPNSVDNLKKVIDFAKQKGFSFIELRDANASLSYDDAKKVAAYAKNKKIEVRKINIGIGNRAPENDAFHSRIYLCCKQVETGS